jgi:hypothetical protein
MGWVVLEYPTILPARFRHHLHCVKGMVHLQVQKTRSNVDFFRKWQLTISTPERHPFSNDRKNLARLRQLSDSKE